MSARGPLAPALALALCAAAGPAAAQEYTVLVASEATDQIAVVRFGPRLGAGGTPAAKVETSRTVGLNPMDPDGPHGLAFAPDGRSYFVSTAHGAPYGSLWRFDAATGETLGRVELGLFPATLQVSPDGAAAYVVNFNLHGEMVPSSVSVVGLATSAGGGEELVEIARIPTCAMPHGSRLTADGSRHYSACMMDDLLVEIDTRTLAVSRHFLLTKGKEQGMPGAPMVRRGAHAGHDMGGHGMDAPKAGETVCSPTWAQPTPDGRSVYVACNKTSEIVEVDAATWALKRRIAAGDGVYNLAITRDAKLLVATNKRGRSVSVFDAASGKELARIPTLRRVVHGVAVSPDDRYAFVSVEGVGSEPGTLEVIDLATRQRVASADVGQMAGGVDVIAAARP
ncbi:YncE family protein [Roseisolibacter sp. H3M3-2]|uniref:YncE family protein n=1 Tax=Roseisolibacter sp. H3M3-2 TaxID=3031323 RepID=UPI0023DC5E6F|nr:YncE family protein [Roseisolibacter sp. H3M3-2]MDF1505079.1 YncE family protein [Roseisolibacter sp. H3M3-2]